MINPVEVACAIKHVSYESSSNRKIALLDVYRDLEGFKEILNFIYNPYLKTGMSKAKLAKALDMNVEATAVPITWEQAMQYFSRHTTGNTSDLRYASMFIKAQPEPLRWLAEALITQSLKIGVTATSLNKVFGATFIPKVGCMLGKPLADVEVKWPCIVTEKLDGARRILVKERGKVQLYTRSGHADHGLVDIIRDAALLPDNMVYDGELLAMGSFRNSIALRQATNSIANSNGDRGGLIYWVFDMIPLDEFYTGLSAHTAVDRKIRLGATLADQSIAHLLNKEQRNVWDFITAFSVEPIPTFIRPVPILGVVNTLSQVDDIVTPILAGGGEGVMLNTATGLYELKRSKQLIKVKRMKEEKLPIIGFMEGNGKYEGMLGAVAVEYKGNLVGVGSGFTDAQRMHIWKNQDLYKGKLIEIDTFGESTNALGQKSLNCPIFKRIIE